MASSPSVQNRLLAAPKRGTATGAYEDASEVRDEAWPVRAAVADGATESMFARAWAETLVEGLCAISPTPAALAQALPAWRTEWVTALPDRTEAVPWYVAAKAREGAFATLLALELRRNEQWRALGIGDCTLFHLRGATLQRVWPTVPGDRSDRPVLLPSRADPLESVPEHCRTTTGTWQPGDAFVLATDAVAAWLHRRGPAAARKWDAEAFRDAVRRARDEGNLRNDDSTLLVLNVDSPAEADKNDDPAPPS